MPKLVSKTAATSARHQRTRIKRSLAGKSITVRNIKAHVRAKKRLLNQVKQGFIQKDVVRAANLKRNPMQFKPTVDKILWKQKKVLKNLNFMNALLNRKAKVLNK